MLRFCFITWWEILWTLSGRVGVGSSSVPHKCNGVRTQCQRSQRVPGYTVVRSTNSLKTHRVEASEARSRRFEILTTVAWIEEPGQRIKYLYPFSLTSYALNERSLSSPIYICLPRVTRGKYEMARLYGYLNASFVRILGLNSQVQAPGNHGRRIFFNQYIS